MPYLEDIPYITGLNQHEQILVDTRLFLLKIAHDLKKRHVRTENDSIFAIIVKNFRYLSLKKRRLELYFSIRKILRMRKIFRIVLESFSPKTAAEYTELGEKLSDYMTAFSECIQGDRFLAKELDWASETLQLEMQAAKTVIRFRIGEPARRIQKDVFA